MDGPETHAPHAHSTGRRWLDIVLAVSALFVSCISLAVAVHHGEVMQKLVAANQRMVQANSWPILVVNQSFQPSVTAFSLENRGIGPARLRTLEVFVDGAPVTTAADFLRACCGPALDGQGRVGIETRSSLGEVIAPKAALTWLAIRPTAEQPRLWPALVASSSRVRTHACFCSVFDECWRIDSTVSSDPQPVLTCPRPGAPWVGYASPDQSAPQDGAAKSEPHG